ncbi:MAG: hypothetical protein ACSHXD_03575 [Marinosulfonomonas sp.]
MKATTAALLVALTLTTACATPQESFGTTPENGSIDQNLKDIQQRNRMFILFGVAVVATALS